MIFVLDNGKSECSLHFFFDIFVSWTRNLWAEHSNQLLAPCPSPQTDDRRGHLEKPEAAAQYYSVP
jgi:hypothetical protein